MWDFVCCYLISQDTIRPYSLSGCIVLENTIQLQTKFQRKVVHKYLNDVAFEGNKKWQW